MTAPRRAARPAQIAGANKLPFAKADVVIDAVPSAAEIDNALKRLESAARDRGMAVGFSSALPASIDRIAKWAKAAQGRGIVLVPITKSRDQDRIELTPSGGCGHLANVPFAPGTNRAWQRRNTKTCPIAPASA